MIFKLLGNLPKLSSCAVVHPKVLVGSYIMSISSHQLRGTTLGNEVSTVIITAVQGSHFPHHLLLKVYIVESSVLHASTIIVSQNKFLEKAKS